MAKTVGSKRGTCFCEIALSGVEVFFLAMDKLQMKLLVCHEVDIYSLPPGWFLCWWAAADRTFHTEKCILVQHKFTSDTLWQGSSRQSSDYVAPLLL